MFCAALIFPISDSMLSSLELSNDEIMVKNIQEELCNMLPQEAVFPSENIITPVVGEVSYISIKV